MENKKVTWPGNTMKVKPIGIVIHSMGEYINGHHATKFLQLIGISAHAFISPSGEIINGQILSKTAFHAGLSQWKGVKNLNSCYLGVELLIKDADTLPKLIKKMNAPNPYSMEQYKSLADLVASWVQLFDIPLDNIVGHNQVSTAEVRPDPKHDPGPNFNWVLFRNLLDINLSAK